MDDDNTIDLESALDQDEYDAQSDQLQPLGVPDESAPPADDASGYSPARATFYGNFEDEYGDTTARPNPLTGENKAIHGFTVAVDPKKIPYGSRIEIPKLASYSANGDGIFVAHDTGGDVKSEKADGGTKPVIDVYSGDAKTNSDLNALNEKYGNDIDYKVLPPDPAWNEAVKKKLGIRA